MCITKMKALGIKSKAFEELIIMLIITSVVDIKRRILFSAMGNSDNSSQKVTELDGNKKPFCNIKQQ